MTLIMAFLAENEAYGLKLSIRTCICLIHLLLEVAKNYEIPSKYDKKIKDIYFPKYNNNTEVVHIHDADNV